jgi:formate hydrogenlyase transcriptional activator
MSNPEASVEPGGSHTGHKQLESLLAAERRTLEMIAGGAGLNDILEALCATIDAQSPGAVSTVLLTDRDGMRLRFAAGPGVPRACRECITPTAIGDGMGTCGAAAFLRKLVITSDIAGDPLWSSGPAAAFRDVALRNGLKAAWSHPLISKNQELLGTFAIYRTEPLSPSTSDLKLIEGAANIAVIAIEGERSQAALRKAFEEVKQSEARLKKIIDTIPALAWCARPDGAKEFFNQRWHDYTGLSAEEAQDWGWKAAIHPDDLEDVLDWWRRAVASGEPGEIEARLRQFDSEYRWFLFRAEPLRDEQGDVVNWYGTNTDIEDRKQAEEKLRQDETELREITDAISQTIMVLAPDGTALYANQSLLDFCGLTMEAVRAPDFRTRFFHPEDVERLRDERREALSKGVPFENEQRARRKDGQYRWTLVQYKPLKNQQGQVLRWYASGTDIEDRKLAADRMHNENLALREEIDRTSMFEEIVGSSEALHAVLSQVTKVAPTDSTVLILGETGVGKELIARAIHKRSNRKMRAFIRVNCAAIPSSLIASELFGHEKGAFTGATQRRLGRFESANGGTIFLDEIGDLPAETQVALLRVLQERELERVGSSQPISVDVRVVAATNRNLTAAVAAGTFREDLYYRLHVFPIQIPPLRERADDIPLLVAYLIDRYGKKAGKKIKTITATTLELFRTYDWPGNVRELQNVVERAVILSEGETFWVDETWLKRDSARGRDKLETTLSRDPDREKAVIEAALAETGGRVSGPAGAAGKLGIPRQTLESKIRTLGIDKHRFRHG